MVEVKMKSYAQNNEDVWLWEYFGKMPGYYVDVGAYDGIKFSNTYLFELQNWTGICVEPNPTTFEKLKANRPKSTCVQAACVSPGLEGTTTLYIPNDTPVIATLSQDYTEEVARLLHTTPDGVTYNPVQVPALCLDAILRSNHVPKRFDLLSVDTEWLEIDVLIGARLHFWQPKMVVVEANNKDMEYRVKEYMKMQGYKCVHQIQINYFFERE